jgi:cell division protein FtsQ
VVLAVLAGWLLLASPWLRVVDVRVSGTERTERSAVQAIVDGERGSSLAAVNTRALAAQVAALPLVQSVDVTRAWPSTLDVVGHEREAVAAVPSTGGGFDLVDENARVLVKADAAPAGVPTLAVDVPAAGVSALRAALDVNGTLPADVRSRVAQISATGPDAVTLQLADGPRVVWGSAERPERKGEVLQRMLADPDLGSATVLDVSAPDAPAVVR